MGPVTEIRSVHPQSPDGDSPGGACGCASLRRHLHCFGFPSGNLADVPVRPCWALLQKSGLSTPSHLTVTAPVGHAAALHCAGTSTASVSLAETSLTFRCGPVGPRCPAVSPDDGQRSCALHPSILEHISRNFSARESLTRTSMEHVIPKSCASGTSPSSFVIFMTSFMLR